MKKIFISAPYLRKEWDNYKNYFNDYEIILPDVVERMEEGDLLKMFNEHPDIVTGIVGDDRFTEKVYNNSNLKFLIKWGTGIDSLKSTNSPKIFNTPSAFSIPVSESTIGMMLSFIRTIKESNEKLHKGEWEKVTGKTLFESKVGIIGLGNVGSEVAKKLESFGCEIHFYDPNVNNFKYNKHNKLNSLLSECDIITIHCDLNPTSYHLIGYKELKYLEGKVLINTARGPVINQKDLEQHIEENEKYPLNRIRIGLDVFEYEPLDSEIIRNYEDSILSAHNTNTSPMFWKNIHTNCIKILKENI